MPLTQDDKCICLIEQREKKSYEYQINRWPKMPKHLMQKLEFETESFLR